MLLAATRALLAGQTPARPTTGSLLIATGTAIAALTSLVGLGTAFGHVLLIPPMAASMALVVGAPALPLAQPRHVIGGQVTSAVVGVVVGLVSHSLWAAALAGGLALGVMLLTRTSHSPAAATAVIGAMTVTGAISFVACTAVAAAVLVLFGLGRAVIDRDAFTYPAYWW